MASDFRRSLYSGYASTLPDYIWNSKATVLTQSSISKGMKLLIMRFLHDISAEQARTAWREGFEQICQLPCYLNPGEVQGFLAAVPPVEKGDVTILLFTPKGIKASHNGRLVGG